MSAPAVRPSSELATASSQSLWVWMPTRAGLLAAASAERTARTPSRMAWGWEPPLVSHSTTHVAPARAARAPRGAERREARVFEGLRREAREELLVLGVGAGEPPFHVIEAETVEQPGDALLVGGRERDVRPLRAVAQGGVVQHDLSVGGHKKTSRPFLAGRSNRLRRRALSRGTSLGNLDGDRGDHAPVAASIINPTGQAPGFGPKSR